MQNSLFMDLMNSFVQQVRLPTTASCYQTLSITKYPNITGRLLSQVREPEATGGAEANEEHLGSVPQHLRHGFELGQRRQ